ncbi:hypothetical protein NE237_000736 [Protea cynaroides]|uniref:Protein kinase domain-containing protein n=1 Tax=Protea cynaroides TaxID=273540 RepID=A0A9Q0QXS5_9MAGN|nr:hypothetical protein NE237_000736 [Protea cynaroides]
MAWTRGRTLGRGSSATVSLAKNRQSGEVYAVKSAEFSRSEFLQREQSILSLINSPRIVGYVGCDVTNENGQLLYNLFIEYMSGGSLTDVIRDQGGCLHESGIRSHSRAILEGLDYLHSCGLVHCDIKGPNVLVGHNGTKIADLGCARWVGEQAPAVPIAGTPLFMAPEVARGEEQSFAADIWALGCTIIEMATGRPPWPDITDPISALHRIAFSSDLPDFPSFLSEEAKDFLDKCVRRDAKERWTAQELLKHPFLEEDCSVQVNLKRIPSSTPSTSPTSILNQGLWQSMESELEIHTPVQIFNQLELESSSISSSKRIRRLFGDSPSSSPIPSLPDWTQGEDWITVRRNNDPQNVVSTGPDEIMTPTDEEELELLGISSSIINDHFIRNSVNSISVSSNSQENLSIPCKDVRDVDVFCNPNYVRPQEKKFFTSSNSILL